MDTKNKILKTAIKLFSEKGFDGTSVSNIAEECGVNKPLIYYYFENKDGLLNHILDDILTEAEKETVIILKEEKMRLIEQGEISFEGDKLKILDMSEEEIKKSMEYTLVRIINFYLKRKDILKVLLTESIKKNDRSYLMFKIVEVLNGENVSKTMKDNNLEMFFDKIALTERFFLGLMPIITFSIYYDEWCKYHNIECEEIKEMFMDRFMSCMGQNFLK